MSLGIDPYCPRVQKQKTKDTSTVEIFVQMTTVMEVEGQVVQERVECKRIKMLTRNVFE